MSEIYLVDQVRDLPAVQFRSAGVVYEPDPAPTATLILPDNSTESLTLTQQGSTTTTRYLVEDFTRDAAGMYEVRYATTDTDADIAEFVEYVTVNPASAGTVDANVVTWLGVAPLALTAQKVNSYDADANADLATLLSRTAGGVTVVAPSTLPTGKTRIGKGKRYTGDDRLEYTSDSQRDLSTDHLVALQFNGKSFPADSITGSAGAWTILVPLTNTETDALFLGTFDGELAVFDTSPNPDQEIPELARFKVTVYANV